MADDSRELEIKVEELINAVRRLTEAVDRLSRSRSYTVGYGSVPCREGCERPACGEGCETGCRCCCGTCRTC
jgi:hypothetical protein